MSPGSPPPSLPARLPAGQAGRLKTAGFKEIALWLLGRRRRFRMEGDSMLPLLKSGDTVLVKPTKTFSAGDVVVCRHPIQSDITLIKQIKEIENTQVTVEGLNTDSSSDSRQFGSVHSELVLGVLTSRLS